MNKILCYTAISLSLLNLTACDDEKNDPLYANVKPYERYTAPEREYRDDFVKGADISWITGMEWADIKFYNNKYEQTDCFELLKTIGVNTMRFRVWVNPDMNDWSNGLCDVNDVVAKCKRATAAGMRIMIDFHYSDSWADPVHQTKPSTWSSCSVAEITDSVAAHTTKVLTAIKEAGSNVEWVQIGNETGGGMLWPDGKLDTDAHKANYAKFTVAGSNAAKSVFPNVKTVLHIQNGWNYSTVNWVASVLKSNNALSAIDCIGLSHYPSELKNEKNAQSLGCTYWVDANKKLIETINNLIKNYGKKVMVAEFGFDNNQLLTAQKCLDDICEKTMDINNFEGIILWEPECHAVNGSYWNGYNLGLFGPNGKPGVTF